MKLVYLPTNQAWVFLFGTAIVAIDSGPRFHRFRADAVMAAHLVGLDVTRAGDVTVQS